jgi:hypothetical protein
MRRLPLPSHSARATFELCAKNVRSKDLSTRLLSVASEIEDAETQYKELGAKASLFTIAEADTVANRVQLEEMKALYKGTLSRLGSDLRYIYDEIKAAPKNGICPLCEQRVVSTLDHYLAQSKHPALTVTPMNLVPSCADCNKVKLDMQPTQASEQTLHPYFDEVDDGVWLIASVKESIPPALVFSANPPSAWDDVKRARVLTHFQIFNLGHLYTTHAAEELLNIRHNLTTIAERAGTDALRAHLMEQAEGRQAAAKNSWQSAMYEAPTKSEWFCEEGYKMIT